MADSVLIVRHGQTPWTAADRVQGWAPVPLTDRGREQAAATAAHVADGFAVGEIVTSDLRRTRQTAEILADELGVPVSTDARWRERDFGWYQGVDDATYHELRPTDDLSQAPESGESWQDVADRVHTAWPELAATQGTPLLVSHFGPIAALLGRVRGLSLEPSLAQDVSQCSIHRIDTADEPTVAFTDRTVYDE